MDISFDYSFKGILAVPGRALKPKKIIAASFFILVAFGLYELFFYLATLIADRDPVSYCAIFGLIAVPDFGPGFYVAVAVYFIGLALAVMAVMTGMMAVSIIDFEELRGNPFLSYGQAIGFALKRIRQLFLSELAIILFVLAIVVLGLLVGLIGRIPVIGEWLYSVFFFFPNFVVAILTVFIIFVAVLSVLIMPATVAADRHGESFNSILETFLTVTRQPGRWLGYTVYAVLSAKVCSFILAYFAWRAVQFLEWSTALGAGAKAHAMIASGAMHLPLTSAPVEFTNNIFPGINFGFDISNLASGGIESTAGYVMTAALFLIFVIIWGYILSVIATGQAFSYAVIKKLRDDYTIDTEQSLFYEEEYINPPIDDSDQTENDQPT